MSAQKSILWDLYTWQYDDNGNLIREEGPRTGVHKEYQYDFSNRLVVDEEIHANGVRLKHAYHYDYLGNMIAEVDIYGNKSKYIYDRFKRRVQAIGPDGHTLQSTEYNTLDQPVVQQDANGKHSYWCYNVRGSPTHVVHPDGSEERSFYNLDGTLQKKIEKDGKTTVYTYDCLDRELTADVYDIAGKHLYQTRKEYRGFHMIAAFDPDGHATFYDYDHHGRIIKTTRGDCSESYAYDTLGRKSRLIQPVSDSDGVITEYAYDALDRLTETTIKNWAGEVQSWELVNYDFDGKVVAVTKQSQAGMTTAKMEYNARGKMIKSIDLEGKETHVSYRYDYVNEEGICVPYREETAPSGNKTAYISDIYGRDKKIILCDAHGNKQHITHFQYDHKGNRLKKTDEVFVKRKKLRDFVCVWEYDACNRPTRQYEAYGTPIQKETIVTYNQHGQKAAVTKPDGVKVTYAYSDNGLLERVYSSDNTIHYQYSYDPKGNPTTVQDLVHKTYTWRIYDRYGQVIHEQQGTGISIATQYDPLGRVKQVHHPDNVPIRYTYDGIHLKRIARFEGDNKELYAHEYLQYDPSGKVTQSALAGGVGTISYDYDILGRVIAIDSTHWKETLAGFDESGNLLGKKVVDQIGLTSDKYRYDSLNQLTAEKGVVRHHYVSDSLHNRLAKDEQKQEVNVLNQVVSDGTKQYEYDLNGNIRCIREFDREMRFAYDAFDRLIAVTANGETTKYRYDEHNRRLSKGKKLYLYHDRNEVLAADDSGKIFQRRVLGIGLGGEIGAAVAMEFDNHLYVPLHDHNGNVCSLIDAETKRVAECYRYSAFGEELTDTSASINPWRFSSKRMDEETGFVFFGRRYYMPETGRWLTADPLGEYDGSNLYAYVKNNPLTHFDVYGLTTESERSVHTCHWKFDPIRAIGRGIAWGAEKGELLFKHLLPPSPVRLIGEAACQLLQGKGIQDGSGIPQSRFTVVGDKPCPKGKAQIYSFGMLGEHAGGIKTTQQIVEQSGGCQAHLFSHPSQGFFTDLLYAIFEKCNSGCAHVKRCEQAIVNLYGQLKKESDHPEIYIHAHSRGGIEIYLATKNLPEEIRKCLYITTYGSGTIIPKEYYGNAENFVNDRDKVPLTDYYGMLKHKDSVTCTGYKSRSFLWTNDHYIDSPGYKRAMRDTIENYANNWKT